ncbi:MAG: tetratricopeptide repeat protein [Pseudomonadota bacterium]
MIATAALGFLGAGLTSTAMAQSAGCTGGGKISKQIAKPMAAAQEAMKAKRWQEVLSKTKEAESAPGAKSQTDLYWISEFRGYAYHSLKQDSDAVRELENGLNSPCMPEAKKLERYKSILGIYSALRNYPKVIDYGNRALKVSKDPDLMVAVAQAYYQAGQNKDAVRVMNELLTSLDQRGQTPKEQQLLLIQAACAKAGDNSCVAKVFEKLVIHYPKPEYWQNLMVAINRTDTDDVQKLNVMRLAVYVNVLNEGEQYKEMAQLALENKLAGEAQAVLEQGFTKNVFTDQRLKDVNTRLLAAAKKEAAADKAALPQNEAAARAAATGDADVKVGAQYLGFGDEAKAIEALQRGIKKGNLAKGESMQKQRADEANMLLGLAYLRNNNKAEAAKAFRSVKEDPTMVRIAKLWLLNT